MSKTKTTNKGKTVKPFTNQEAQAKFVEYVGKPDDSKNSYVNDFLKVIGYVISEKRSFTLSDLQTLAKPYDLPPLVVTELAEKWISTMQGINKIELCYGAYDEPIILVLA